MITAISENRVIGKNNDLVWSMPEDMKRFKTKTIGHHIVMGRKTFESFGKPLKNRTSIVISRQKNLNIPEVFVTDSLENALKICKQNDENEAFIIGGAEIYRLALPIADKIYLTIIHHNFEGDTFFPEFDKNEWNKTEEIFCQKDEKNPYDYTFLTLERKTE